MSKTENRRYLLNASYMLGNMQRAYTYDAFNAHNMKEELLSHFTDEETEDQPG